MEDVVEKGREEIEIIADFEIDELKIMHDLAGRVAVALDSPEHAKLLSIRKKIEKKIESKANQS